MSLEFPWSPGTFSHHRKSHGNDGKIGYFCNFNLDWDRRWVLSQKLFRSFWDIIAFLNVVVPAPIFNPYIAIS
jgi:hypothetical protein